MVLCNSFLLMYKKWVVYENDKERFRKQARDKYTNLSEEEKNKNI